VAVGCIALLTFVATEPGGASPDRSGQAAGFSPGTGNAIALGYKVNPAFGGLSFGITAGESVAGHQNTAASAQSKAVNLGVIGVTLAGEGCDGADPTLAEEDQPQPVTASSDDPEAANGNTGKEAEAITMLARATKAPFAEAVTTVAPVGEPGVALISGAKTTATSGVVEPGVREARAVTEIASLTLLDVDGPGGLLKPLVELGGMRWEAIQRTGAKTTNAGLFEIGSLSVQGKKIALPSDSLDQVNLLNDTLNALGFQIVPPTVRQEQGIVFVDPMKIGIIPSDLRDGLLLGPALSALQGTREAAVETLFRLGCGGDLSGLYVFPSSSAVTILDLAVGSISGAGSLNLELGGVQATTAELGAFEGLGDLPPLPDLPALTDGGLPGDFTTDVATDGSEVAAPPVVETPAAPDATTTQPTVTSPIGAFEGQRGGALLGVGAGGMLMLLASAEGDRRKMRRAQREIPLEV
jgi:hypothetical protein